MTQFSSLLKYSIFACIFTAVFAKPKTVIYWGQESDGKEKPLREYCASGNYDIIVMGFAYEFPTPSNSDSAYPALNFASHCETPYDASNPLLLICPGIGADITYCQSLGVEILLSFGGGVGRYGFNSDAQAVTFATLVWNMFMEGTHPIRPFGNAIINGIDLDIEGGGTGGYIAFINTLRSYFATSSRSYSISSAPQCPYPDGRLGPGAGTALGGAWMDYVFVQFYNNYCGLEFMPYLATPQFNFDTWAKWAQTAANPNVKVFIGAPAAKRAAGAGYVDISKLQTYAAGALATYPSIYGGVMLWDASNSDNNGNYGALVSAFVKTQAGAVPPMVATPVPASSTTGKAATAPVSTTTTTTTGMAAASTTTSGKASTTTTTGNAAAASTSTTTGKAVATPVGSTTTTTTTGRASTTTTSSGKLGASAPTPVSSTTTTGAASETSSSSTTCDAGSIKCLTSETFSMCAHGQWNVAQSCQQGLVCRPHGSVIYCERP